MKIVALSALLALVPASALATRTRYGPHVDPTMAIQKDLNRVMDDASDGDGIDPADYFNDGVERMGTEDQYDNMPWDAEIRYAANNNSFVLRTHPPTKLQMIATTKLAYGHVDGDTCGHVEPCNGAIGGIPDARDVMQLDHGCRVDAPAQEYLCRDGYVEQKLVKGACVYMYEFSSECTQQPDYYRDNGGTFQIWKSGQTSMNEALDRTKYSTRYPDKTDKTCIMAVAGSDDAKDFAAELNYDPVNPGNGRVYNTDTVRNNGLTWGVLGVMMPQLQFLSFDEYIYTVTNLDYTKDGGGDREIHSGFYDYMTEDTNVMGMAGTKMSQHNDCKQWFYTGHSLGGVAANLLAMTYGATGQKGTYSQRWDGHYGTVYTTGALSLVWHDDGGDLVGGFRLATQYDPAAGFRTTEHNKPDSMGDYKFEHVGGSMIILKGSGGLYNGAISAMQYDYHTDKCDGAGHIGACRPIDHDSTRYCEIGVETPGLYTGGHALEKHNPSLAFTCGASGSGFGRDGTDFCPSCCQFSPASNIGIGHLVEEPMNWSDNQPSINLDDPLGSVGPGPMSFAGFTGFSDPGLRGGGGPVSDPGAGGGDNDIFVAPRRIAMCNPADCGDNTDDSAC